MQTYLILTVGWHNVAIPFDAKLADALAKLQREGISVESTYCAGRDVWYTEPSQRPVYVRIVSQEDLEKPAPEVAETQAA